MSKRLNDLRARLGQIFDSQEALLNTAEKEKRELTAAEKTAYEDLDKDYVKIQESIVVEERLEERRAQLARPIQTDLDAGGNRRVAAQPRPRMGKLTAFKGAGAEERAWRFGAFAMAAVFGSAKARTLCGEHGIQIQAAQSEGVNTAGGFLVPIEFSQDIIDLREEFGTFRQAVRPKPLKSDSVTIPRRAGGLTAYPVGENVAATESQKSWSQVQLVAKKWAVLTRMSTELDEDAFIDVGEDLASEMAYAFAVAEDAAGWNGDGTSTYNGIVGVRTKIIDGTHTASAIDGASGHDTAAEIDATDLITVMAKCPKYALRDAAWYMSQLMWAMTIARLVAAAGGNTMMDLAGKPQLAYLGYPVVIDQTLPAVATDLSDVAMLFFGSLGKAVTFGERRGFSLRRSDEAFFVNDQIAIMATERIDINVHDLGDNTTPGPLIALIGE